MSKTKEENKIVAIVKTPDITYGHTTKIKADPKTLQRIVDGYVAAEEIGHGLWVLSDRDGHVSKQFNCSIGSRMFYGTILVVGLKTGGTIIDAPISFQEWKSILERRV